MRLIGDHQGNLVDFDNYNHDKMLFKAGKRYKVIEMESSHFDESTIEKWIVYWSRKGKNFDKEFKTKAEAEFYVQHLTVVENADRVYKTGTRTHTLVERLY